MKVLVELETEDIATIRELITGEIARYETHKPKIDDRWQKLLDSGIDNFNAILAKLTF